MRARVCWPAVFKVFGSACWRNSHKVTLPVTAKGMIDGIYKTLCFQVTAVFKMSVKLATKLVLMCKVPNKPRLMCKAGSVACKSAFNPSSGRRVKTKSNTVPHSGNAAFISVFSGTVFAGACSVVCSVAAGRLSVGRFTASIPILYFASNRVMIKPISPPSNEGNSTPK